ncbi:glycosyltransferase family 9 protein [Candidatus Pelagibacter communis]|uniref:glycosyltransferase family 9 protein n=1 Tax=Pelagibacter ubique TaxID=198252 RepID=UPI00094D7FC0|nr:glycosyltransferase family 9 protein [Candidatus Pelagibacter ubique]|tara:strand:+ start:320 stop:1261 length:942 start_codon:yes stop_codon:yes gene_type:complete
MSNILIIKHGSLGDIAQASGAIQDISENHKNDQIYMLTTKPYFDLFKKNPFIHDVILDKRLPRYNLIYLYFLMRELKKHKFSKIFDLQNSTRTNFYKNILFPKVNKEIWSSSITTLPNILDKKEFDKHSVLDRFNHQLQSSGLKTYYTLNPDFSWACSDISKIKNYFKLNKFILLFPFCSPHLNIKKWPYYNDLIKLILDKFGNEYKIVIAPGPSEIKDANKINALVLLDNGKALSIPQLSSLIKESSFIIANDTGPAHIAAHVGAKGLTLFGKHTTAYKVSIERENFKAIQVTDLNNLSAEKVFERLTNSLN